MKTPYDAQISELEAKRIELRASNYGGNECQYVPFLYENIKEITEELERLFIRKRRVLAGYRGYIAPKKDVKLPMDAKYTHLRYKHVK